MAGRTPALQQNWQRYEKTYFLRKNTISNEHPVGLTVTLSCSMVFIYRSFAMSFFIEYMFFNDEGRYNLYAVILDSFALVFSLCSTFLFISFLDSR